MRNYDWNDGRVSIRVYREGWKWWLAVGDSTDATYLELRDFKTKSAAVKEAEIIKAVAPKILTRKDREAKKEIFMHGGPTQVFGRVHISYGPLYGTPMGRGFGTIVVTK